MSKAIRQCQLCEATSEGTQVQWARGYRNICTWCADELKRTGRGYCPRCVSSHPLSEMRDGYCKAHKHEMNREYYQRNAERERARVAAYRSEQPDYWKEHPRTPEQRRAYYHRTREQQRAAQRRHYQEHKNEHRIYLNSYRARKAAKDQGYWTERRTRAKLATFRRLFGR